MQSQQITIVKHPIIDHSLTILRDKTTTTDRFRRHASIISKVLILEASKSLNTESISIHTPLAATEGKRLVNSIVLVPVLRAGLAMLFAAQEILPGASVGFVGLERDEQTAIAKEYYKKLPQLFSHSQVFILDPMLATGGSFDDTISLVKLKGGQQIQVICVVSAPEGIQRVHQNHPDVHIYSAAIDHELNEKKYIVPGLGDFGDRYFGTEQSN